MAYIWENYDGSKKFYVGEVYSPYLEIMDNTISSNQVNPLIRFGEIFNEISKLKEIEFETEEVENVIFHYLAAVDLMKGLDEKQIFVDYLDGELRDGAFGAYVSGHWDEVKNKDKKVILHTLLCRFSHETLDNYFFLVTQKLFSKVSLIYEKSTEIYYFYIADKKTSYGFMLMEIVRILFWNIQCKLQVVWHNHYGIVGVEETMGISDILII